MGRRGPAPKPSNIVKLEGNPGHRKINRHEPKPRPIAPDCPEWLDPEAKAAWKRVLPILDRMHVLTVADGDMLAVLCQAVAELEQTTISLRDGLTFKTDKGYVGQHPAVAIRHQAMRVIRAVGGEFGLSPAARVRLIAPELQEDQALADLLD
jgi:P27 family predicted phage terminase small subunit